MVQNKKYMEKRKEAVFEVIGRDVDKIDDRYLTCVKGDLDRVFDFGYDYGHIHGAYKRSAAYEASLILTIFFLLSAFVATIFFIR